MNPDRHKTIRAALRSLVQGRTAGAGSQRCINGLVHAWLAIVGGLLISLPLGVQAAARQPGASQATPAQPAATVKTARSAQVSPPAKTPPGSSAGSPLSDLDRALLEGLPAAPPPPAKPSPSPSKSTDQAPTAPAALPAGPSTGKLDPAALQPIAQKMLDVKLRLEKLDTSPPTQEEQARIIQQLRQLVGADAQNGAAPAAGGAPSAENQAVSKSAPMGSPPPAGGPGGALGQARGSGEVGQAAASPNANPQDVAPRLWGHLPEKIREEMRSALSESFVPKYERLIEQYYRRLAEQPPSGP